MQVRPKEHSKGFTLFFEMAQKKGEKQSQGMPPVSGLPFVPNPQSPVAAGFQQHQFPPPIPPSYLPHGYYPAVGQDSPPPPNIYYTHYPPPPPSVPGPNVGLYGPVVQGVNHGRVYTVEFEQESVRESFVQRVLFCVSLQLLAVIIFSMICVESESIGDTIVQGQAWLLGFSFCLCFFVSVARCVHPEGCRRKPFDVYLFLVWSIAVIMTLTWIITLLNFKFLLITVMLLWGLILSILISTYLFGRNVLSFRSSLISSIVLFVGSALLLVVYHRSIQSVLFADFLSMLVLMLLFFRLHSIMGDEQRKFKPTEVLHATTCILF